MNYIPYGKQVIDDDDVNSVIGVLRSDWLTQGPVIDIFEKALADYCGARYCIVASNGTAALHLAVAALEVGEGREGITSPNTFVASANALVYNNIKPVFADIDPKTYNIDPHQINNHVSDKSKVIIPVHFAGQPCDMEAINNIAEKNNLFVVEDAAHAIGSRYVNGSRVGNCQYSDMTTFSFHPVKTMTTGEGGAITTNSEELYNRLKLLRTHGITKDFKRNTAYDERYAQAPWYYEMQELGFNYRMTDLQAALGLSQLKKLDDFIARRREIVTIYNENLSAISWLIVPFEKKQIVSAFHLYVLQINYNEINKTREKVIKYLRKYNIGTQVHYIPVHTQPFYQKKFQYKWGDFPEAEKYYEQALSIPLYPGMHNEDVMYIVDIITRLGKEFLI